MHNSVHCSPSLLAAAGRARRSFADARSDAKAQVEFGISVAQRGLWREAIYRWEKAIELDPDLRRRVTTIWPSRTSTKASSTRRARRTRRRSSSSRTTPRSGRTTSCSRKSMTARVARTVSSARRWRSLGRLAAAASYLRDSDRNADPAEARRLAVPARPRRRLRRRRQRRRRREPGNRRLLRSQLRTKSALRVIDADVAAADRDRAADGRARREAADARSPAERQRPQAHALPQRSRTKRISSRTSGSSPTSPTGRGSARNSRTR